MGRHLSSFLAAIVIAMVAVVPAGAQETSPSTEPAYVEGRALVSATAKNSDAARNAIARRGGRIIETIADGKLFVVETPGNAPEWVASVRSESSFRYAELDYIVEADTTPTDPRYEELWGMTNIDAPRAWDTTTGDANVTVGVIDTGVNWAHEDLNDQIWENEDEIAGNGADDDGNGYVDDTRGWDCRSNDNNPTDDNDHGTHVAGTIGAEANNGVGVAGVNWNVSIVPLKFLSSTGSGSTSDAIECLYYAIKNDVMITNNSWGGGGYSQALADAITAANNAGQLFIAAAGNSGVNTDSSPHYPSSYTHSNIISVAATDSADRLASWSNYGSTSVDLAAPGVSILSTVRSGYSTKSGTSMAAPHVAGAAALLWASTPSLGHLQLRDALFGTVDEFTWLDGKMVTGGRLDIGSAMAAFGTPPPAPDAPVLESAVAVAHNRVDLGWTDSANETSYSIERSPVDADAWSPVGTNTQNDTTFSDTTVTAENTYRYRVTASNSGGSSSPSNELSVTTPAVPPIVYVHVGDIDGTSTWINRNAWRATVTIMVEDDAHEAVSGAAVSVSWSGGSASCTTGSSGTCSVSGPNLKKNVSSITFTVKSVTAAGYTYDAGANHDPDGSSNGTVITITRP